ncbi:hypothetical protein [Flavobacterium sp.]|uniref:hypothetical protein n=1 Tax=Flavobacterium sp. TaxID=239 RepID=UPI00391A5039
MTTKTLQEKAQSRKSNKHKRKQLPQEIICKTVGIDELKTKIENKIFNLFKRSMSAKHEKSTSYVTKAINGELPTMRIANKIRVDYAEYQKTVFQLIEILKYE